jgi:hypothetical protein
MVHDILSSVCKQLKYTGEGRALVVRRQPLDVLHEQNLGLAFKDKSVEVQNELSSRILQTTPLSRLGEGLAGNPSHQNIHASFILLEMKRLHVSTDHLNSGVIDPKCLAACRIQLVEKERCKSGVQEARTETSGTRTDFNEGRHYESCVSGLKIRFQDIPQ